jgi:hypothetical protein
MRAMPRVLRKTSLAGKPGEKTKRSKIFKKDA